MRKPSIKKGGVLIDIRIGNLLQISPDHNHINLQTMWQPTERITTTVKTPKLIRLSDPWCHYW